MILNIKSDLYLYLESTTEIPYSKSTWLKTREYIAPREKAE